MEKNFAYAAAEYAGDASLPLTDGAEAQLFEGGNRESYSAGEVGVVIFGFRTFEHHSTQAAASGGMNETIIGTLAPPNGGAPVTFATVELAGSNVSARSAIPQVKSIDVLHTSYPALLVRLDNAALQKAHGSGDYRIVWKSVKAAGMREDRELAAVATKLTP